jgi:hypothetical protein
VARRSSRMAATEWLASAGSVGIPGSSRQRRSGSQGTGRHQVRPRLARDRRTRRRSNGASPRTILERDCSSTRGQSTVRMGEVARDSSTLVIGVHVYSGVGESGTTSFDSEPRAGDRIRSRGPIWAHHAACARALLMNKPCRNWSCSRHWIRLSWQPECTQSACALASGGPGRLSVFPSSKIHAVLRTEHGLGVRGTACRG